MVQFSEFSDFPHINKYYALFIWNISRGRIYRFRYGFTLRSSTPAAEFSILLILPARRSFSPRYRYIWYLEIAIAIELSRQTLNYATPHFVKYFPNFVRPRAVGVTPSILVMANRRHPFALSNMEVSPFVIKFRI